MRFAALVYAKWYKVLFLGGAVRIKRDLRIVPPTSKKWVVLKLGLSALVGWGCGVWSQLKLVVLKWRVDCRQYVVDCEKQSSKIVKHKKTQERLILALVYSFILFPSCGVGNWLYVMKCVTLISVFQ